MWPQRLPAGRQAVVKLANSLTEGLKADTLSDTLSGAEAGEGRQGNQGRKEEEEEEEEEEEDVCWCQVVEALLRLAWRYCGFAVRGVRWGRWPLPLLVNLAVGMGAKALHAFCRYRHKNWTGLPAHPSQA